MEKVSWLYRGGGLRTKLYECGVVLWIIMRNGKARLEALEVDNIFAFVFPGLGVSLFYWK